MKLFIAMVVSFILPTSRSLCPSSSLDPNGYPNDCAFQERLQAEVPLIRVRRDRVEGRYQREDA
jgi:hypothetical protein